MPRSTTRAPRPMYVDYAGYRYPVATERFIIGRSRKECDLAIADTNVSRQHALVEWFNGCFHIVDMGSTNGIEFNGQRVYRRIIRDGDVFHIAGHELRFGFG
jgi:pSer/pThr/pTyr-binding forkhead associated (FHA) protein